MQDNDEISVVRRWISAQRVDITNQIAALRVKLTMCDQIEQELNSKLPVAQQKQLVKRTYTHKTIPPGGEAKQAALLALSAAGDKGLTSNELAEVAQLPIGTASSRLSLMNKEGIVRRFNSRYFVVHSAQEDNNVNQSA